MESLKSRSPLLKVSGLTSEGVFHDVSFEVPAGEILGIGGLAGAGQEGILRSLFGDLPITAGEVEFNGEKVEVREPRQAIGLGFAYAPRNRDREGIVLNHAIRENISPPSLPRLQRFGMIERRREDALARRLIQELQIKCRGPNDRCGSLSGGNRQKVVLARAGWRAMRRSFCLTTRPGASMWGRKLRSTHCSIPSLHRASGSSWSATNCPNYCR